jgi:4'-phosphopantetheinyl transferase EntD
MFSAKEAFIKLNYSMENILLDFLDVRISFDNSLSEYTAYTSDPTRMAPSLEGKAARGYLGWNRQTVTAIMYVHRSDKLQYPEKRGLRSVSGPGRRG